VNLGDQRELFEIPEGVAYLNCAYISPQLRAVREVGEEPVRRKSRPWEIVPKGFFEDSEAARASFAELVGGEAEGVAIIPSVSYGMAVAAANVPVEAGQRILILEEQFPSNVYPWRELAAGVEDEQRPAVSSSPSAAYGLCPSRDGAWAPGSGGPAKGQHRL
jgi:selenocysteine lyase/cysteine desulfurase